MKKQLSPIQIYAGGGIWLSLIIFLKFSIGTTMLSFINDALGIYLSSNFPPQSLIYVAITASIYALALKSYDTLTLLDKYSRALSCIILYAVIASLGVKLDLNTILVLSGVTLSLGLLFNSYQASKETIPHLIIGCITAGLSFISPIYLGLTLLWLSISYQLKCFSWKGTLALFLGVVIPFSISLPILTLLGYKAQDIIDWVNLAKHTFEVSGNWRLYSTLLIAALSCLSFGFGEYKENIRQRALGSTIVTVTLFGIPLSIIYPSLHLWILPALGGSILIARWLNFLSGTGYKFGLISLMILFSTIILFN